MTPEALRKLDAEVEMAKRRVEFACEFGLYQGRPVHEDEETWFEYVRRLEDALEVAREDAARG